jgi:hypothetical protein
MDVALKPCPFCGGKPWYTEHEKTSETRVGCVRGCGSEGPFGGRSRGCGWADSTARDGWNARPIEDALRADVAAAEARMTAMLASHDLVLSAWSAERAEVAAAEARGRAAERAEIVAVIRERAEMRRIQVEQARAGLGDWQAVDIKAGESEAIADGIERRGGGAE